MRYDEFPLREKMTLFLHGHFATGQNKVKPAYVHYRQNLMLRKNAGGNWKTLVTEISRDPAMLLYLDNAKSSKKNPNENYARELMELFTLGEGNYSEQDIQEVARAFTGWSLDWKKFSFEYRDRMHDHGEKTLFGRTGNFGGEDVIDMIIENPQAADFLAWKLTRFFVADSPNETFQQALAAEIRKEKFELKPVLRTLFLSEAFYRPEHIKNQIKSPAQWLVGMLHDLECPMPPPHRSIAWLDRLGQKLFQPPNVKGWDGGFAWITASSLLSRYNFAGEVVHLQAKTKDLAQYRKRAGSFMEMMNMTPESMEGGAMMEAMDSMEGKMGQIRGRAENMEALQEVPAQDWPYGSQPGMLVNAENLLSLEDRKDPQRIKEALTRRLFQSALRPEDEKKMDEFLQTLPPLQKWGDADVRTLVHLMMSTPQYQMM
jgi:uncharacterized protein (DUF1800 family)